MNTPRKIIHVDMDAFFASVEQRDDPALRNRPMVVGGSRQRGVVAAASYEARAFGIHSAMPTHKALALCPQLLVAPPRMAVYQRVSGQIRAIFLRHTPLVEPLSLDEAYLDVTENHGRIPSATRVAQLIKAAIREETGLTASAGVSSNKFLAKIASDMNKPDGLTVIPPERADAFLCQLPIEKFHGVGRVTAERMHRLGIHTGEQLRHCPPERLLAAFGKVGLFYHRMAWNRDERPVNPHRIRKSVGAERTFDHDLRHRDALLPNLRPIADKVLERMERQGVAGRTVTLKIKFSDFRQITRSRTLPHPLMEREALLRLAERLLRDVAWPGRGVRLLGLSLSNLEPLHVARQGPVQLTMPLEP